MKKVLFLFLAFSLFCISFVFAEISLRCEVDKESISTDDELAYKLIVSSSEKNIPAAKSPTFQGFSIISQAQSSTVIFGQSNIKTLLVYTYILAPLAPGKFKIEPGTITVKDKTYASQEIEVEVTEAHNHPGRHPEEKLKARPEEGPPNPGGPQITL